MKKRIIYKKHYKTWHFHSVYCLCALKEKNKQTNTHFEILGYFSQQISQKQKVAGMNLFVYGGEVGVYIRARLTWMFESERRERRVGVTVLDIMSWDRKTGHRVGFIRITLTSNICFGRDLLSFKSRHFKLSIHIFLMYLRRVFAEIQVVLFTCLWRKVTETEPAENAPCLFY